MKSYQMENGFTLIMALVMLLVLGGIVVSALHVSSMTMRIADNMRTQNEMENTAQYAVEQMISSMASSMEAQSLSICIDNLGNHLDCAAEDHQDSSVAVYQVQVDYQCLSKVTMEGFSAAFKDFAPFDADWNIRAAVTDQQTGGALVLNQGIRMGMANDAKCP